MGRVVLVVETRPEVAVRDPCGLARPATVDEPRLDREHPPDGLDRPGSGGLPAGVKVEVTDLDAQGTHDVEDNVAADGEQPRHTISTHVLDTERGVPASGVRVTLYRLDVGGGKPVRMTQALTDADGRVRDLLDRPLQSGDYRLEFDLGQMDGAFFTKLAVDLSIGDIGRSYHVPLLLAPYSMTTYRGS